MAFSPLHPLPPRMVPSPSIGIPLRIPGTASVLLRVALWPQLRKRPRAVLPRGEHRGRSSPGRAGGSRFPPAAGEPRPGCRSAIRLPAVFRPQARVYTVAASGAASAPQPASTRGVTRRMCRTFYLQRACSLDRTSLRRVAQIGGGGRCPSTTHPGTTAALLPASWRVPPGGGLPSAGGPVGAPLEAPERIVSPEKERSDRPLYGEVLHDGTISETQADAAVGLSGDPGSGWRAGAVGSGSGPRASSQGTAYARASRLYPSTQDWGAPLGGGRQPGRALGLRPRAHHPLRALGRRGAAGHPAAR